MVDAVVGDFKKEDLPYLEEILTRLKVFFEKRLESI
jgi:hypothetical protein